MCSKYQPKIPDNCVVSIEGVVGLCENPLLQLLPLRGGHLLVLGRGNLIWWTCNCCEWFDKWLICNMRLVYKMQISFRYSDSNLLPFYHRTTDISISIQVKIFTQDRSWSCKTARNTITPDMQNPTWTKFVRYLLLAFLKRHTLPYSRNELPSCLS